MTDTPEVPAVLQPWTTLLKWGLGVGAVLFGALSGFWQIDNRLEAQSKELRDHGTHIQELAKSVKVIADRSASLDVVDAKIEAACMRLALANRRLGVTCPFAPMQAKAPARGVRTVKTTKRKP